MVTKFLPAGLFLGILVLAGARFQEDDLSAGTRAFAEGDGESALKHFEQALLRAEDPGLVAYHQGVVLAALGRHAEAAAAWGRTLEDAESERRIKAAYGQGTALTHVAAQLPGRRAVKVLQQALPLFDLVIRESKGLLVADARHNKAVAEALLARKRQEPEPPEPPDQELANDSTESLPNREEPGQGERLNQPGGHRRTGAGTQRGAPQSGSDTTQPGSGNLPTRLDEDRIPPLPPEQAERRLDEVMKRLRRPQTSTPLRPGVKDW